MDDGLRRFLRQHKQEPVDFDVFELALRRAGICRERLREDVRAGVREVFVEQLDSKLWPLTVEEGLPPHPERTGSIAARQFYATLALRDDRGALLAEERDLINGQLVTWRVIEHGMRYYRGCRRRDQSEFHWEQFEVEDLPEADEASVSDLVPDTIRTHINGRLTLVYVFYPTRDMLHKNVDFHDVRFVVDSPLQDRAEVLETMQEVFPHATVVSRHALVEHVEEARDRVRRPPRDLKRLPYDEEAYPKAKQRMHVRP